ncbi:MAG: hypothetical protein EXQ58_00710 [Acidobacteria bacterium]|nr:hypothetical protein [Acidobacteriota bacterium]
MTLSFKAMCASLAIIGVVLAAGIFFCPDVLFFAQGESNDSLLEPEIHSLFPMGGRPAITLEAEIRGKALKGAYAVFLSPDGVKAHVIKVEAIEPLEGNKTEKKGAIVYRVLLRVEVAATAKAVPYSLRLVSPQGVSNGLYFHVHKDQDTAETETPHDLPAQAQRVTLPVIVNGRISKQAEVDYYRFEVLKDQPLAFELISTQGATAKGFQPQLTLYAPTGSWMNPDAATRLATHSEMSTETIPINSGLTYHCKKGPYVLQVRSLSYNGAPDFDYLLRLGPSGSGTLAEYLQEATQLERSGWQERNFTREIGPGWIPALWARADAAKGKPKPAAENKVASEAANPVKPNAGYPSSVAIPIDAMPTSFPEVEPNDGLPQAAALMIPALVEGSIDCPGDVDTYRFDVKLGEKLAFEIQTPGLAPPHFVPVLEVKDASGRELLTNVHKTISVRDASSRLKTVESKVIDTFEQSGEHFVQIRDITSRFGNSGCKYRLLVRHQIPHVGETRVLNGDHMNLFPGQSRKFSLVTTIEEIQYYVEFGTNGRQLTGGEVLVSVEGLPHGVKAFPATEVEDSVPLREETFKRYSFVPDTQKVTIVLQADSDAPHTTVPQLLRLFLRPLIAGRAGPPLKVAEIPLMVTKKADESFPEVTAAQ